MIHALKKLLLALCCLAAVAAAALSLPWMTERAIAGTLDTTMPFATQAPEPEAASVSPAVVPLPTQELPDDPSPDPTEALPWATLPPLTPAPTAMPMSTPIALNSSQDITVLPVGNDQPPPDWRGMLQVLDQASGMPGWSSWEPLLDRLEVPQGSLAEPVYRGDGNLLIAEALLPADMARQKLLSGLLAALDNPQSYIPQDTLQMVMDLPMWAASDRQGEQSGAVLSLTNRQRMDFAVLDLMAQNPPEGDSEPPYSQRREAVCAGIADQADLYGGGYDRSMTLVREFSAASMQELAVIQAEPYLCNSDWDYRVAGHHVVAVDLPSGRQYTLTTDLISDKVIGLAEEYAEPYLKTYAHLLEQAQTRRAATQLGTDTGIMDKMEKMMTRLSGIDFFANPANWVKEFGGGIIDQTQSVWTMDIYSAGYEARLMDTQGDNPLRYSMVLDDSLALYTYEVINPRNVVSGGESMPLNQPNFDDLLWKSTATYAAAGQDELVRTLQYAANEPEQLALQQLSSVNLENDGLFNFISLRALNIHWQEPAEPAGDKRYWVTLSAELTDQRGLRFVMEILVHPDHSTSLLSMKRADTE